MNLGVYDVNLYWHDGGSLFLGAVESMSPDGAQQKALQSYIGQGIEQKREIEEGGNYQLEADPLPPDEAAAWRMKYKT